MNRRKFIKNALTGSAILAIGLEHQQLFASDDIQKLTILHTNDVHSRIDPFPADDVRYAGMGGVAPRAALIKKIREEEEHVLLFDAGDVFQGTPYFNFYGGEPELKLMSTMGYDAGTMGNHDFDNGVEGFLKQIHHANFPFLTANYGFSDTPLHGKTKSYQIFKKGRVKVGVYGLGIQLDGLVNKQQYGNTVYLDPIETALKIEAQLKNEEKCDLIICLSHLGYKYDYKKVSDHLLAAGTYHTHLIIGGHTHTFLTTPTEVQNAAGKQVIINQVGFAGINLGRLDFAFGSKKTGKMTYASAVEPVKYISNFSS